MEILDIKNLKFKYPNESEYALNDVNLSVNEGEILLLCGASGSGKTTLLRLLKKQLSPSGESCGKILLFGKSVEESEACDVGFVMQNPQNQIVTDKVWHELAFGLENLGLDKNTIRLRTGEMASFLGISSWFDKNTNELSGGQTQILNLASVMAMQPRLLLLDEPISQLDPIAAREFLNAVLRLNRETGATVIMSEHRLEDAFLLSDRVAVMDKGKIAFCGTPSETAEHIISEQSSSLFKSLPASAKIFSMTGGMGECPLDIRQGRAYLRNNFSSKQGAAVKNKRSEKACEKIIRLRNTSFRYEKSGADIIKNLSFNIYGGENLCILGANGAGKSTLLRLICGSLRPYIGKVKCKNGLRFALLPQRSELVFLKDSLNEDFMAACLDFGLEEKSAEQRIAQLAEEFDLTQLLNRHPYDLSGGETQRAALAKLMINKPDVLLLDEPTKGIDPAGKDELSALIKKLCKDGITVVTVTHDIEFAACSCERCALLFNGEIISSGEPAEFFCGNSFYTTAANRISRGIFKNAISCEQVAEICNGGENEN